MKIIGYSATYEGGRELAKLKGFDFAYIVASGNAPKMFVVMV